MRNVVLLVLASALLASTSPGAASAPGGKEDEVKKTFVNIAKSWEKGKVDAIVQLLPPRGKVTLELRGVKRGAYRKEQAHALLKKYFGAIETISFKKEYGPRGGSARFKHVYLLRADRQKETHKTHITLGREESRWVIVDIREF